MTTRKRLYGLVLMMLFFSPLAHAVTTSIDGFYRYQNETDYKTSPYQKDGTGIAIPAVDAKIPISDALVGLRIDIQEAQNGQQWQWEYFDPNGVSLQKSIMTFYDSYLGQNGCFVFSFFSYACGALNGSGINGEVTLRIYCREVGKYSLKFTAPDPLAKTYNFELISTGPKADVQLSPAEIKPQVIGGGEIPNSAAGKTDITIKVTDSGCPNIPIPGATVRLEAKTVAGSGGHTHMGEQKGTGTFSTGTYTNFNTVLATNVTEIKDKVTDRNGEVTGLAYTAGVIGLEENLIAHVKKDPEFPTEQEAGRSRLTIKIPGLVQVGQLDYAVLVGQTASHAQNHYALPETIRRTQILVARYKNFKTMNNPIGKNVFYEGDLRINDMSLKYGGMFDVNGNFIKPHSSHETGVDVDIGRYDTLGGPNNLNVDELEIAKIAKKLGGWRVKETPLHIRFSRPSS